MRICTQCGLEKDIDSFNFADKKAGRKRASCKDCDSARYRAYKNKHEDRLQESWRAASKKHYNLDSRRVKTYKSYGLTEEDYLSLFESQDGKCWICGDDGKLFIDHCHKTGKVRGLLCPHCNRGLGGFKDNLDSLANAMVYLNLMG